jgi:glutaconyl-CoA/methylmalonyl-CoA decarboxylase subunit gamma
MKYVATVNDDSRVVDIVGDDGRYRVSIGDEVWEVDARRTAPGVYSLLIDGASYTAGVIDRDGTSVVEVSGESYEITVEEQSRHSIRSRGAGGAARSRTLTAPLPGKISRVAVGPGDMVAAGDTLIVIEAMKMENEFKATGAGTVAEVRVTPGQLVNAGDVIIVMA